MERLGHARKCLIVASFKPLAQPKFKQCFNLGTCKSKQPTTTYTLTPSPAEVMNAPARTVPQ